MKATGWTCVVRACEAILVAGDKRPRFDDGAI